MGETHENVLLHVDRLRLTVPDGATTRLLVEEIELALHPGEIVTLAGPSGMGKSTLLRTIIRLKPFDEGAISLDGVGIREISPPALRARIGYLSQLPSFTPGLVSENLLTSFAFRAIAHPVPDRAALVDQLQRVGLEEKRLDTDVEKLSGGEKQRVALVRLLLIQPEILLLDEPTANLDSRSGERIIQRVREWVQEGERAVLWVSHDREVTRKIGGRALRLTRKGFAQWRDGDEELE